MKKLAVAILIALLTTALAPAIPVLADELSKAQSAKSTVDSRISQLNADKKKILAEKAALEKQKTKVANQQAAESNAYKQLVSQINQAEKDLQKTEADLAEAEANYAKQQELVKTRLRIMYENSSATMLDTLLESKSLVEFFERLQYMSAISKNDSQIISDLNDAKLDVDYKKQLQEQAKAQLEDRASDKQDRLTTLKVSRSELETQITRSQAELNKLEKEEDALLAESKRLNSVISNLSKKNTKYAGGSMKWPVPSSTNVTSSFGMRMHPILRKMKMHTGIDIAAPSGNSIIAANSGKVIIAQYDTSGGYGKMIVIDHGGGISTLYGHCSKLLVGVGDTVKAGEVIAKVGSTGLSTGPHLHFEVREKGVPVNPLKGYLSK